MNVEVKQITPWSLALDMARQTVGKEPTHKEPSDEWKIKMLRAEHSPIRCVQYLITCTDVPYWVVMHLVRHHQGIEKFVCTQRSDRTGTDRHSLPQDAHISCSFICNAQALINISRVRLCSQAATETHQLWWKVRETIKGIDPLMANFMVPNCIYRGFCPEFKGCGIDKFSQFENRLEEYRNGKDSTIAE